MTDDLAPTRTQSLLAALTSRTRPFTLKSLLDLRQAVIAEKVDVTTFRAQFDALLDGIDDELVANVYARAEEARLAAAAEFEWAKKVAESAIFRRLMQRTVPASTTDDPKDHEDALIDDSLEIEHKTVQLPHPTLQIALEPIYGDYNPDPDVIETILPKLKPEEREKALTIIEPQRVPRQVIPAFTTPRVLKIGNTGSLKALRDKYAESAVGQILKRELSREFKGWRLTIKPAAVKKDVTPRKAALL